jgi:glutamine---fructose-6-phosphate transaminase (isomerizing)
MIKKFFLQTIDWLKRWKIYVGVEPQAIAGSSLVFFPLSANVLFCGLAGILTVKRKDRAADPDAVEHLQVLFEKIRKRDIKEIIAGTIAADRYLEGTETMVFLNQDIMTLKGDSAFERLFFDPCLAERLTDLSKRMNIFLSGEENTLEVHAVRFSTRDLEIINSRLVQMKDICWALEKDILDNIERILRLTGAEGFQEVSPAAFGKYRKINFLLNCLARLEVRGRDSAGIQLSFTLPSSQDLSHVLKTLKEKGLYEDFFSRSSAGDLVNGSVQYYDEARPYFSFTYKTASIIGDLGRNIRELRGAVSRDALLQAFAGKGAVFDTSLAHTRWASVGSITEDNCHPINNYTSDGNVKHYPAYGEGAWFISVVLNGDIDNYQSLRKNLESGRDLIAPEVTTDTKIIPLQIEKYLLEGHDLSESFRRAVSDFEGSHAIAMASDLEPARIFLALKGSGQTIYVGISPDGYIFSSELYGLVEGTSRFLKMDGEKLAIPQEPGTSGQIFILNQESSGGITGIEALYYNGLPLVLEESDLREAEITTRDIDRGSHPHYFLKEISESALSVRKTLRGKYRILGETDAEKQVVFNLGTDVVPENVRQAFLHDEIRRIVVIGHGTAAVAGAAIADAMERYLKGARIKIEAKIASELSGFFLEDDLKDTLVMPITQSGTTTDTNRAVAMAVERGASVIAIVNRRQSDITGRSDGVFYTSDGRDIEMSVASTKAFYSQIVAGHILALYLAQLLGTLPGHQIVEELRSLEQAPDMMNRVLNQKEQIRNSVSKLAGQKKYWAVVGSGPNKAAADEIRIKLSELCYKTISSDVVENKKHIDLSAEPLIIVCAAGNPETVMGDIVKDVAIFKAHKAGVIVFADEGEDRFHSIADAVISIPRAAMPLPVILNTVAGHLWGYYAACSIDDEALFFREFRSRLNLTMIEQVKKNYSLYDGIFDRQFRRMIGDFAAGFNERLNRGSFSIIGVKTIADIVLLLKYAMGKLPLEDFWHDFGEENGIASPIDMLDIALGQAVDELSRPIDAIRHQAKTVTVGTSRKEQPLRGIIYNLLTELIFSVKSMVSKNVLTIGRIQPAIGSIRGYTLYDINHLDSEGNPGEDSTIAIRKKGGISLQMKSRTESTGLLMGTKRTIVSTGHVYVGRGKSDGAPLVIIPLLGDKPGVRSLLLIHVVFNETLPLKEKKEVLGYQYNDIRNLINEYNLPWNDRYLDSLPLEILLGEPPDVIAGKIRQMIEMEQP